MNDFDRAFELNEENIRLKDELVRLRAELAAAQSHRDAFESAIELWLKREGIIAIRQQAAEAGALEMKAAALHQCSDSEGLWYSHYIDQIDPAAVARAALKALDEGRS